jgi:hypothetical protein
MRWRWREEGHYSQVWKHWPRRVCREPQTWLFLVNVKHASDWDDREIRRWISLLLFKGERRRVDGVE